MTSSEYYLANREKVLAASKEWRKNNPEKRRLQARKEARGINGLFRGLKECARKTGREMTISLSDYSELRKRACHYCSGKLPETGHGLDRLDNSKGYSIENVVPCCTICNRIRNKYLSEKEMLVVAATLDAFRNGRIEYGC